MYYKNYPFWYFPCNYNMHPYFIVIYLKLLIYQLLTNMRTRQQFNSIYSPAIICASVAGPESLTWVEGNLNANFGILLSVLFHLGCDAQFQDTLAVLNSDLFPLNPIRLSLCLSYIPYITIRKMPSEKSHSMNIDLTVCASLLLRDWESPAYPILVLCQLLQTVDLCMSSAFIVVLGRRLCSIPATLSCMTETGSPLEYFYKQKFLLR